MTLLGATLSSLSLALAASPAVSPVNSGVFIRTNQVGYLPDAPKVAVVCMLDSARVPRDPGMFVVRDEHDRTVFGPRRIMPGGAFAACARTFRLDFSALKQPGRYRISAFGAVSRLVRIDANAYAGGADTLLHYLRQQRSGWNPVIRDSVHKRDGVVVDDSANANRFVNVSGGWADASDYLQYVTTSANATFSLLLAYRDNPAAFADAYQADGQPGSNGVADVLDEARHGLEWLLRMFPGYGEI
jgi:hypothetical protein